MKDIPKNCEECSFKKCCKLYDGNYFQTIIRELGCPFNKLIQNK